MEQFLKEVKSRQRESSDTISSPSHYVAGRTIQPIDVIEDWDLGYQLACVVKYIARAGRKNPILEDLKKAEWYLDRALSNESALYRNVLIPQQVPSDSTVIHSVQSVCDDWQLSDLLCSTLINIFLSRDCFSQHLKEKALIAALDCLREEIIIHELRQNLKLPVNKKQASKKKTR